jgi:transcriptional regulator with XRE-family HTH domain
MTSISSRVMLIRKTLDLTQDSFSQMLGISRSYVASIERGTNVSSTILVAMYEKASISLDWLVSGRGSMFIHTDRVEDGATHYEALTPDAAHTDTQALRLKVKDVERDMQASLYELEQHYARIADREKAVAAREAMIDAILSKLAAHGISDIKKAGAETDPAKLP